MFGKIKSEYVDQVDDATLLRNAIRGMLSGLDPHSTFLDPEDFEEIKISTDGRFGGLGIEVTTEEGLIKIVTPIDGTPAYEAGLKPGDLILEIDDQSVRGMSLNDAVDLMRGEPGSKIQLTVEREGESENLQFELVRAIISLGHSLGLDIVVEGVERLEELQFFRDENARVIQGFLFSAPVAEEKLREMLREGHFAGQLQILDRILDHSLVTTMEQA